MCVFCGAHLRVDFEMTGEGRGGGGQQHRRDYGMWITDERAVK